MLSNVCFIHQNENHYSTHISQFIPLIQIESSQMDAIVGCIGYITRQFKNKTHREQYALNIPLCMQI